MKRFGVAAVGVAAFFAMTLPGQAGVIERACLGSDRAGGDRALCGCIQNVADLTLDRRDQRLAARFFRDPQHAQDVRQSDQRSHEIFWRKYRKFGDSAAAYCS